MSKISLLTMAHANPIALKRTLDSFKGVVDEVIFGDLPVFQSDRELIKTYVEEYKMTIVPMPFNYIFHNGFGPTLNVLAHHAKNDWCLYMNCSEIVDGEHRIPEVMDYFEKYDFNCYPFNHATDPHSWIRCYRKSELHWSGPIHEELSGIRRPAGHYLFQMADTEKDMDDLWKAKIANDIKEIVYFQQYTRMVEDPSIMGATNFGWLEWARTQYESMKERLNKKGNRYAAFQLGNLSLYMREAEQSQEFKEEKFESSTTIEYQGDPKFLGK